jgi:uracil-DNA glycosylase
MYRLFLELQSQSHQKLVAILPAHLFDQLHTDWQRVLQPQKKLISHIESKLVDVDIAPEFSHVFRSLSRPIESTRAVIFGQDPYPTKDHAHGLAFSVDQSVSTLPPSLRNILTELSSDLGITRRSGDLSDWFDQGVLLVNRVLTTQTGSSLAHSNFGWQEVTDAVAQELGRHDVVAILWGKSAGELSRFFRPEWQIQSVHPSPLSAYRGFFGSKPFSRCNEILVSHKKSPIHW